MNAIDMIFANVTTPSSPASISLTNGAFAISDIMPWMIQGMSFDYIRTDTVHFNAGPGFLNASIQLVLSAAPGAEPAIEVTFDRGTITVYWTSAAGRQSQQLTSGEPMTLSGFTG